ncbi:hypothetical protein [Selenomonas ruminantium]|uniref:hypothetical protein n=1 Tax=Selenomonas ruminantium TaxID=971 RepID=UPI00047C54FB|nr:hypothetical protein [Selenomonas ruminantium]
MYRVKNSLMIVYSIFTVLSLWQCILGEQSIVTLSLRGIDEMAFHDAIRQYYNFNFPTVLTMNAYAYGEIFWLPLTLLTFPFYWLGYESVALVIPRLLALFFTLLSCIYIYKIISIYTKNGLLIFSVVFLNSLYPIWGWYSTRIGTIPECQFFSIISIYYAVKQSSFSIKNFRKSLLFFAVALGTKISCVIVLPVLVGIYIYKFYDTPLPKLKIIREIVYSILAFIFFFQPIIYCVWEPELITNSMKLYAHYAFERNGSADYQTNIKYILENTYNTYLYVIFVGGGLLLLYKVYAKKQKRLKEVIVLIGLALFGVMYLVLTVPIDPFYMWSYALCINWLFPFLLIGYDSQNKYDEMSSTFVKCVLIISVILHSYNIYSSVMYKRIANLMTVYQNYSQQKIDSLINARNYLCKYFGDRDDLKYCIDYTAPLNIFRMSTLESAKHTVIWDDNFNDYEGAYDFYILDKKLTDNTHEISNDRRKQIKKVKVDNLINDSALKLIYEDDYLLVLIKSE